MQSPAQWALLASPITWSNSQLNEPVRAFLFALQKTHDNTLYILKRDNRKCKTLIYYLIKTTKNKLYYENISINLRFRYIIKTFILNSSAKFKFQQNRTLSTPYTSSTKNFQSSNSLTKITWFIKFTLSIP